MTKDVTDCALMLQAIAGHDANDSTSVGHPVPDYLQMLNDGVKGMKLGVPKEYFIEGIDKEVRAAVDKALQLYVDLGATLVDISLPHTDHGIATYYLLATAEASSNLARYDGVRYGARKNSEHGLLDMYLATRSAGFGTEVKRRIMLGTYVLSAGYYEAYYAKAQKVRKLLCQDFARAFEQVDAIVTPTMPSTAFKIGENVNDPLQMYLADVFTVSCNLAGLPGISIPCGFTANKLPIGLQILARPFAEDTLLRVARAYEQQTDWHTKRAVQ
jgi:aspartyl-tRNA(Asn)/glutamyl-tRNA(Gln) amidotransferase subunit A